MVTRLGPVSFSRRRRPVWAFAGELVENALHQAGTQRRDVAGSVQKLWNQQAQPLAGMGQIDVLLAAFGFRQGL